MSAKFPIEDLSSDLAHIGQITSAIAKQARSILQKAQNAQTAGYTDSTAQIDGTFYLARELYDIDATVIGYMNTYMDRTVTKFKDLHSFTFGTASPTTVGPYYRNWPTNFDCVTIATSNISISSPPATINGVAWANGNRVLVINQTTASENGVYLVVTGAFQRDTAADIPYCTVRVTGGSYASTCWWNYSTTISPKFVQQTEFTVPTGLSGDPLYASRSATVYGVVYYTTVKSIDTAISTLKTQLTTFVNDVTTLRSSSTTLATTITNATAVLTDKTNIDASILTIEGHLFNVERLASYYAQWLSSIDILWSGADRTNQVTGGFLYKSQKPVAAVVAYNQFEKTYNNNYTHSQGDASPGMSMGSGAGKPSMPSSAGAAASNAAEAMYHHNAIIEYWAQIGWQAAERTSNYKTYVELLENDLIKKDLEEIVDIHDKAVKATYEAVYPEQTGFLNPQSPKPVTKYERPIRDKDLPWTQEELDERDPI